MSRGFQRGKDLGRRMTIEIWKDALGFEGLYEVSDLGRVKRIAPSRNGQKGGNILHPRPAKTSGYLQVCLSHDGRNKWFYLHVLVCTTFQGPRPAPDLQCCHDDGVRSNCRNDNLRWDTRKANEADRIRHGTHNRGERHGLSKLTDLEAREIKEKLTRGRSQRSLAKEYGVSTTCIADIQHGRRWVWLKEPA